MEMTRRTNVGRVRDHNEDSTGLIQMESGTVVAIVADGMGGHLAGDVASRLAVDTIEQTVRIEDVDGTTEDRSDLLIYAISKANEKVHQLGQEKTQCKGMGTTVVTVIADEDEVVIAHVGDSRAYMLHNNGLYQLTEDHSFVNVLLRHGQITPEEARNHPQRNMIVRAVGTSEEVEIDVASTPWKKDNILLLCSDGLNTEVEERQIGLILSSTSMTLEEKADELIRRALEAGGKDNVSLILLKHTGRSA